MVAADVVQVLDLVDADDPVFAGECLLNGVELRSFCRQTYSCGHGLVPVRLGTARCSCSKTSCT